MAYQPANTNGQATMANSSPVVVASDQTTLPAGGNVAADAVDSGNPLKVGAIASSSEPAAVANADRANFYTDLVGKHIVLPFSTPENFGMGTATASAAGTSVSVLAAAGASTRWYLTGASVWNKSVTNTGVEVRDGSTTVWYLAAPGRSGSNHAWNPPLRMTANTAVNAAVNVAAASAYVSFSGYKGI